MACLNLFPSKLGTQLPPLIDESRIPFRSNSFYSLESNAFSSKLTIQNKKLYGIPRAQNNSSLPPSPLTSISDECNEKEISAAFDELSNIFCNLEDDFFIQLPNDLKVDLKDAGFIFSSGSLKEQFGDVQGENLNALGRSLEKENCRLTQQSLADLSSGILELPPGSASRAVIGKKFIFAARKFSSMGNYAEGTFLKIGKQLETIGNEISKGCDERSPSLLPPSPQKVFKFGELQVEITREKAITGFFISILFGIVNWKLTAGISEANSGTIAYANENANTLAKSLLDVILLAGNATTTLAGFAALGLLSLAISLPNSEPKA